MSDAKDPSQKPELPPTVAWDPADIPEDSSDPPDADPLVGTLLRGKWRVLNRIGAGSFGTVYRVRDEKGGWIEALKILSLDRLKGPESQATRARFLREARIMKKLGTRSRHIVRLTTYEEDLESGLIYFLMEHVEGRNLAQVLDEEGPFSVERAIAVGLQACDALIAAHESDPPVVHRDLKLQNLMLTEDDGNERLMVLDFGIATIAQSSPDSRLTTAGAIGTPGYAAPEQLRAEAVDGRTDLFALGVILYALVTGRDPWLGKLAHQPTEQVYRLMAATDRGKVRPLEEAGRPVPPALAQIILRLLRHAPDDRFQSARELREALLEVSDEARPVRSARGTIPQILGTRSEKPRRVRERRLAAVWFTDLVGYSSLSATDEGAALELLETFHATARKVIEDGGGRLVQFIGDAAFAEFTSTERAVRTALQFHERFEMATAGIEPQPMLRTGVHVGDVIMAPDGDLFGDGVNVAARIQDEAKPGQIAVSQDVWRQLKQRRDFHFTSIGERHLKGLGGPVWLFAILPEPPEPMTTGRLSTDTPVVGPQARRNRFAHVAGVAIAHLTASGAMLFASTVLVQRYGFPPWVIPGAALLLAVGLILVLVTAWVQSRPTWERSVSSRSAWSLDLPDIVSVLRRGRLPDLTWARTMAGGVLAFIVLFSLAYVLPSVSRPGFLPGPAVSSVDVDRTLAILPFRADGASELVSDGMMDLLGHAAQAVGARVEHPLLITRSLDDARTHDVDQAVQAARGLGSAFLLMGSVTAPDASSVSIEASLVDTRTGEEIRTASMSGPLRSLPTLAPGLVADLFSETALAASTEVGPTAMTDSYEALEAYLQGEASLRQDDWSGAVSSLERAREADPDFALGLARLAFARALAQGAAPHEPDPDAERALELASELPLRQARIARGLLLLGGGSPEAIEVFDSLTREDPEDAEAWHLLGDATYHVVGPSTPAAREAFETAISLADGYGPSYAHLIAAAMAREDTTAARERWAALREHNPQSIFLAEFEEVLQLAETEESDPGDVGVAGPTGREPRVVTGETVAEPDPLAESRAMYRRARTSLDALRARILDEDIHPALAGRLEEADALRDQARRASEAHDFERAIARVEESRAVLEVIAAAAPVLDEYERVRGRLDELRSAVRDPAARAEADSLEGSARNALEEGRYREAVETLQRALTLLEEASDTLPSEGEEPVEPPPPPPEAIVEGVLESLAEAMAAEDIARVRSVWTSISPEAADGLQDLFDQFRELSVDYEVVSLQPQERLIVVDVRTVYDFVAERGGQPIQQEVEQVFEIAQRGGAWVIVGNRE